MGNFEIKKNESADFFATTKAASDYTPVEVGNHYQELLEQNAAEKLILLPVFPLVETPSDNFSAYTIIERTIINFLREHPDVQEIDLICPDDASYSLAMVVYNYWFSESKAQRKNDGRWD